VLRRRPMRVLVSMTGVVVVTYVAYRLIPGKGSDPRPHGLIGHDLLRRLIFSA
jgi:hypothetical protein